MQPEGFTSKGNAVPLAHDQSVSQTSQFSLRPPLLGTLRANPDHSSLALISEAGGLFKQKSYSSKSCCRATEGSSWPLGSRHTGPSAFPALVSSITTSGRGWQRGLLAGVLRVQGSLLPGVQILGVMTQPRADCSSTAICCLLPKALGRASLSC